MAMSMPVANESVRVFISSTFRDMHAERDHLVTVVFPELRERVEQLGLVFFDVDLRWGVPETGVDGEKANSWEYCKRWIDRVEPFFVCMLGQRYGWVPQPHEIRDGEDRKLWGGRSVTDMEIRHAVLSRRVLRRSSFYFRVTLVPEPPHTDPAIHGEFVDTDPISCRNLEQLKADIRTCGRPVRSYTPRWTGKSFEDLDAFGHLVLDDLWSGVLRDERYVGKDVWRRALDADPDADPRYTDESRPVPPDLAAKLVALAKPPPQDTLDAEREQMDAFAQTRLRWFQGRTQELGQLTDFLASTDENAPRLAVVAAAPGQGKSALLAKLAKLAESPSTDPSSPLAVHTPLVVKHFVGATERSATAHTLVERLIGELDRSGIAWPADGQRKGEETRRDFDSLCVRLRQRLGDYAGERRIVILIDALNQLTDGHDLHWLPNRLGPGVRVVVSCVEVAPPLAVPASAGPDRLKAGLQASGSPSAGFAESAEQRVLRALATRQPAPLRVPLGPLTEGDIRTIVVDYLKEYCHELDRQHLDALCAIPQARNPLYLLVMLNELRTLGGNDLNVIVPARIASMSRDFPDTVALFRWVLQRLEVFNEKAPDAVKWWCLYLAHGRVGMASHELADLLVRKLGPTAAATAQRIERGLRRYLLRRGGQLDFSHSQLRQAVFEQFGEPVSCRDAEAQSQTTEVHGEIADYFVVAAKGTNPKKEWETDNVRGFGECVFHLTKSGRYEQAAGLLTCFPFLLHKCRIGMLDGVFEDYDMVRREVPVEQVRRLGPWADFFREKAHILRRESKEWPAQKIFLQLAIEHAGNSPLSGAAKEWQDDNGCEWTLLYDMNRPSRLYFDPCQLVLDGHSADVTGTIELPNGKLISWADDGMCILWDLESGRNLETFKDFGTKNNWLVGEPGALFLPEGQVLLWANRPEIRLLDLASCKQREVFRHHGRNWSDVRGVLPYRDGLFVSWGEDCCVRVWRLDSGEELRCLQTRDWVKGGMFLQDGRFLGWGGEDCEHALYIWDLETGRECAKMLGHTGKIRAVIQMPSGHILSRADNDTYRIWTTEGIEIPRAEFPEETAFHLQTLMGIPVSGQVRQGENGLRGVPHNRSVVKMINEKAPFSYPSCHADGFVLRANHDTVLWDSEYLYTLKADGLVMWRFLLAEEVTNAQEFGPLGGLIDLPDTGICFWAGKSGWIHSSDGVFRLDGHTDIILGMRQLSGKHNHSLLSWSQDGTLRIWNARTGASEHVLYGHNGRIKHADELSDGRILSRGWLWTSTRMYGEYQQDDSTVRVWQVPKPEQETAPENIAIHGMVCTQENRAMAYGVSRTPAGTRNSLWLVDADADLKVRSLPSLSGEVTKARATSDGKHVATLSKHPYSLAFWDATTGEKLAEHEIHGSVWGLASKWENLFATVAGDAITYWRPNTGLLRSFALDADCEEIRALPDERLLFYPKSGTPSVISPNSDTVVHLENCSQPAEGGVLLNENTWVAWTAHTIHVWELCTGRELASLSGMRFPETNFLRDEPWLAYQPEESVKALSNGLLLWSVPYSRYSFSGEEWLGSLGVWNYKTKASVILEKEDAISSAFETIAGSIVALPLNGNDARLFDINTGALTRRIRHDTNVMGGFHIGDGEIVTWAKDGCFSRWQSCTGRLLAQTYLPNAETLSPRSLRVCLVKGARSPLLQCLAGPQLALLDLWANPPQWVLWHCEYDISNCVQTSLDTYLLTEPCGVHILRLSQNNIARSLAVPRLVEANGAEKSSPRQGPSLSQLSGWFMA
ncbi:DUF4062 domain-containing protein [Oligosphaera ethanolica]|uniref:WD40 repeat protein n=1 Tax=Oligosphaera ethanolica TaxID=760260 RepID=A0AAE3VHE5_9BACT|nr:DUF4062 domain-containing protein [Oligosphaera ethanolica]MDQ0290553.1 WD40 repeat protein [Oligosphaera ethanolica]